MGRAIRGRTGWVVGMAASGWRERFEAKLTTAERAVGVVDSGDRVFVQGSAASPIELLDALAAQAGRLQGVRMIHLHLEGGAPHVRSGLQRSFRHEALFIGANTRQAVREGRADYIPVFLSDVPELFRSGALALDVALLNLSTPDQHGYCSLGTAVDVALAAAQSARTVVALINRGMPRSLGDSFVHVDRLTWAVEANRAPIATVLPTPSEVEQQIGAQVAELVEDGATLQLGIGAIPNAVLARLGDRRDLGVHTEMFSDGVVELAERGVITGARKTLHAGKIVASFVLGSEQVYRFVDDNPAVEMHPADYTNDTAVIRRNANMVAINSAIEVDLSGQVVADSIGARFYSGVGGQMDFMRGAALSPGGKAIIALPSTTRDGRLSRIVPTVGSGAGVVTTRAHVQYVITEYGIAALHGKSVRERARTLIQIAHPAFRERLEAMAVEQHWL
jgi:4-hydroxybutyrate CoA-transferase